MKNNTDASPVEAYESEVFDLETIGVRESSQDDVPHSISSELERFAKACKIVYCFDAVVLFLSVLIYLFIGCDCQKSSMSLSRITPVSVPIKIQSRLESAIIMTDSHHIQGIRAAKGSTKWTNSFTHMNES